MAGVLYVRQKMRIFSFCLLVVTSSICSGGKIDGDNVTNEWHKAFHETLHVQTSECYLISIYDAKNGKWNNWKSKLDIKATIVGVVKGTKNVGDKISFHRVGDGGFKEGSKYEGELYYIFYYKTPMDGSPAQGEYHIDAQDPLAMYKYSEALAKIALKHPHKKIVEQVAAPDS